MNSKDDYIANANKLVIERLRNQQRQTDGKPLSECANEPNWNGMAGALLSMSQNYEWGGIEFDDEMFESYKRMYDELTEKGMVPFDCFRPEFIKRK